MFSKTIETLCTRYRL